MSSRARVVTMHGGNRVLNGATNTIDYVEDFEVRSRYCPYRTGILSMPNEARWIHWLVARWPNWHDEKHFVFCTQHFVFCHTTRTWHVFSISWLWNSLIQTYVYFYDVSYMLDCTGLYCAFVLVPVSPTLIPAFFFRILSFWVMYWNLNCILN